MHHTLGTGEFGMYHEMAKHISVDTTVLMDPETGPGEIDRVLGTMMFERRPVYVGVPVDMSCLLCDAAGLRTPIETDLPSNDQNLESKVVAELRYLLESKYHPIIIVDGNAIRKNLVPECKKLSELTSLPTLTTCMGKGGPDETTSNFGGVYEGSGSHEGVKNAFETSDCVFWIGRVQTDFNAGEFTDKVATEVTVEFQRFFIKIITWKYGLKMVHVLRALIRDLEAEPLERTEVAKVDWNPSPANDPRREAKLTQDYLWPVSTLSLLISLILNTNISIDPRQVLQTKRPHHRRNRLKYTSAFGLADSKLPSGATMYNQTVYGSIGYATGAALGAFKAIRESSGGKYKRLILVTGEGSLHLTVQTFADLFKLELNPIMFVLKNDGYTVERLIHGKEAYVILNLLASSNPDADNVDAAPTTSFPTGTTHSWRLLSALPTLQSTTVPSRRRSSSTNCWRMRILAKRSASSSWN